MDNTLISFQNVCQKVRYSSFPVVACMRGLALGGGCELLMHCDAIVAVTESYIGLVEVGVGVIPAGGGCKEMLLRANHIKANNNYVDYYKLLEFYFMNIAMAKTSGSAFEAKEMGYLKNTDYIIANDDDLLSCAMAVCDNLNSCNYRPPIKQKLMIGGDRLYANLQAVLVNYLNGAFISEHDYFIAGNLVDVITGGGNNIDAEIELDQQNILDLERKAFISLLQTEKSQARIMHMLTTGKALRN
jgi:3-hydroxyacyl-CoA dehydrogenase